MQSFAGLHPARPRSNLARRLPSLASCRLNRRSKGSEQTRRPFPLRQTLVSVWPERLKTPPVSVRLQLVQTTAQLAHQAPAQEPLPVLLEPSLSVGAGPERPVWRLSALEAAARLPAHRRAGPSEYLD